ncbi:SH3 domain-containing protein [Flavobacterium sp. PL02]|uniref:SH3 domain-containing protein n=1 Tax=Flavobacterium sp. PL02 TaxID=3088354 RepID=UPI002B22E7DD|nr:SH3 domain-containing protein [Flavobacterium sp. PL02]MEA9414698.1 SH3 domain-containing protein [Flavobacterium sp. PL02]
MKKITSILLLLAFNICFSQFGIINDPDGYVNVRNSAGKSNKIIDKLDNGAIVYNYEPDGNWVNIDYKKGKENLNGYVYKDRIIDLTNFTKIPVRENKNGVIKLENNNVKVAITEIAFSPKNHKLKYNSESPTLLETIDDQVIFGTDGNIPKRKYKSIEIEVDKILINVPENALKNAFEPNLEQTMVNYDSVNDILYIQSSNSDGAGSYVILWVIEKKKFKTRAEARPF